MLILFTKLEFGGDAPAGNASLRPCGSLPILWARPVRFCGGGLFYICGDAQSLPCVRGGGKNLLIFAGGVVNPPVSFADSPLYTRGPLSPLNSNLSSCCVKPINTQKHPSDPVAFPGEHCYNDGAKATVNNLVAGNPQVNVTDKSGWSIRVLGGFKNGASQPGENNYALSTMILSVNGVPKKVTDNILDGYAKTEDELKSKATYEKLGWSFSRVWKIDEANGWPTR